MICSLHFYQKACTSSLIVILGLRREMKHLQTAGILCTKCKNDGSYGLALEGHSSTWSSCCVTSVRRYQVQAVAAEAQQLRGTKNLVLRKVTPSKTHRFVPFVYCLWRILLLFFIFLSLYFSLQFFFLLGILGGMSPSLKI